MPLFEIAVIQTPTENEHKNGVEEKLVMHPTAIIAKDKESAVLTAGQLFVLPAGASMEQMKVLVRPFV